MVGLTRVVIAHIVERYMHNEPVNWAVLHRQSLSRRRTERCLTLSSLLSVRGLDGFDGGRYRAIGDVGARYPRADERFTLVLGLNPHVYKPGVVQHPFEVVQ